MRTELHHRYLVDGGVPEAERECLHLHLPVLLVVRHLHVWINRPLHCFTLLPVDG